MVSRWVYTFDDVDQAQEAVGGDWDLVRALLGGKGANLGEMTRIGVPVPPGFTITTEACKAYLAADDQLPEGLVDQVDEALRRIEAATGKAFGNGSEPLLVSCRSGAKFSMPGMMDTVLNIGMNEAVIEGLVRLTDDEHFVYDSYRRLIQMFGSVVLGVRDEPFEQVLERFRAERGVSTDSELDAADFREIAAEYKRRQAPPGVKITRRSFGRDRRYPLTNAFREP